MHNSLFVLLIIAQAALPAGDAQQRSPKEEVHALLSDWDKYLLAATKEAEAAQDAESQKRFQVENRRITHAIGKRALDLAKAHPGDPASIAALTWVVDKGYPPDDAEAYKLLIRDGVRCEGLESACIATRRCVFSAPAIAEQFLRLVIDQNGHRNVKGTALFGLAEVLAFRAEAIRYRDAHPEERDRYDKLPKSPEDRALYRDGKPEKLIAEVESLYTKVLAEFSDVPHVRGRTLGDRARGKLEELRSLNVGQTSPEIEGQDVDGVPFRLSDYREKVVVLAFSGNWCGPCRGLYPKERELVKRLAGKPFVLLGINTDEDKLVLKRSITSGEVTWRCWWDGAPGGPISGHWGISAYPTVYVLDHLGVIRAKNPTEKELDSLVDRLVGEVTASGKP